MTKRNAQITLKDVTEQLDRLEDRIVKVLDDHERRLRDNEKFITKAVTIIGIITVIVSSLMSYVWSNLFG